MEKVLEFLEREFREFKSDVREDLNQIKQDVKELNQFKWKVFGGSVVLSALGGILAQILIAKFGR